MSRVIREEPVPPRDASYCGKSWRIFVSGGYFYVDADGERWRIKMEKVVERTENE